VHHAAAQHRIGLRRLPRHAHGLILAAVVALALALGAVPAAAQPACGEVITEDTTLTADLDCGGPVNRDAPLTIGADGITLDLGGHTLSGVTGYRIINQGHDNVTIRNGRISSDGGTILLDGVTGNKVEDITNSWLILGMTVKNSSGNRIVNNRFDSVILWLSGSDHNVIAHNLVTSYEGELLLSASNYNRIADNVVWSSRDVPFSLSNSDHNSVRRNVVVNDSLEAVYLSGADDNELLGNAIASTGRWRGPGAHITDSNRNLVARNTFWGVTGGIWLKSGADNVFRRNDLTGDVPEFPEYERPPRDGIRVDAAATGTVLRRNHVRRFDSDGVHVEAPGTRIGDNSSDANRDLGFEAVPGVIDAGGNTASGNGNPLQCTNVFCG
jgi:parallel beta-helix repeat protein